MKATNRVIAFLILLFFYGCYDAKEYDLENLDESSVIKEMTASPSIIPADGVSFAVVSIRIPENADIKTVKFNTSAGNFEKEDTSTEAINGLASIRLYPGNTIDSAVTVEAEIAGLRKSVNVAFIRAFPESIITEPGTFDLVTGWGNELTITNKLKRNKGVVTPGAKVEFNAMTESGQPIGAFRDIKDESDANGQASAVFSAGEPAGEYTGVIYLIGTTHDAGGIVLSDTATVLLVKPE